jgi:hypothetical protein
LGLVLGYCNFLTVKLDVRSERGVCAFLVDAAKQALMENSDIFSALHSVSAPTRKVPVFREERRPSGSVMGIPSCVSLGKKLLDRRFVFRPLCSLQLNLCIQQIRQFE